MKKSRTIKLKVCGMREDENIFQVAKLLPDYLGFIFYKASKRYAGDLLDNASLVSLPESIVKTGVFVNAGIEEIKDITEKYGLTAVQLHGDETPEFCQALQQSGLTVIKVMHVGGNMNWEELKPYETVCDFFLFDTASASWGGTGRTFDWSILEQYPSSKPFFLSGGIGLEQLPVPDYILEKPLWALDINSRFEIGPGLKDVERIKEFKEQLNKPLA